MLNRLFVLGLGLLIGCAEGTTPEITGDLAPANEPVAATPVSYDAGQTITIHVPDMHCPFACYPKVKETLLQQEGIAEDSIQLVEQKDEASINDPRIVLTLDGNLNVEQAFAALAEVGFSNATVVNAE